MFDERLLQVQRQASCAMTMLQSTRLSIVDDLAARVPAFVFACRLVCHSVSSCQICSLRRLLPLPGPPRIPPTRRSFWLLSRRVVALDFRH